MEIKVSIIIAAYNIEKYIEKSLESVVNQTFKNLEIIVVNDVFTDNKLEEIESFKRIDKRIIWVNEENKGVTEARKSGFRVANGEYVLFIDGDDWLDLKAIETLYKIAQKDNYDIVQYGYYTAYEDNTLIEVGNRKGEIELFNNDILESLLKCELSNNIWSKFIKREFIIENDIFFLKNISYGKNLVFGISLLVHKQKVYITNKFLYYYYQRSTSLTNSVSLKILEIADVTIFVKEILINNGLFQRYRKEFEYMAYIHNYYLRKDYIYLYESELSKKIFSNWKKLNISMNNNKYYKKLYEKDILVKLTKNQIKITKGIYILFMLLLHLFCTKTYEDLYTPILFIGNVPLVCYLALFGDCCVAIYCFCSGYELLISYKDNEQKCFKNNLIRIFKLYINYWIILFLFVNCLGHIMG